MILCDEMAIELAAAIIERNKEDMIRAGVNRCKGIVKKEDAKLWKEGEKYLKSGIFQVHCLGLVDYKMAKGVILSEIKKELEEEGIEMK